MPGCSHCPRRGRGTDRRRDGLRAACAADSVLGDVTPRVIVVNHDPHVGSDIGASARPVIEASLSANGVESGSGCASSLSTRARAFSSTRRNSARVDRRVVCGHAGRARIMHRFGRSVVTVLAACRSTTVCLRVDGVHNMFAAGDVAATRMDSARMSVMSCQHGRPMGRFAGYDVVSDLLGEPMMSFESLGMSRYWIWDRQARSTPRAGSGKSSRLGPTRATRRRRHAANLSTAQRKPR